MLSNVMRFINKDSLRGKVCGIWDVSVAFFHSPMDEFTVVRPPPGLRVKGKLWVLNRGALWNSDGQQVFRETCCGGVVGCTV